MTPETPLLRVRDVAKSFPVGGSALRRSRERVRAVDDVSLEIPRGATLGIVGESGSGKSTLGRVALRVVEADRGEIHFDGEDLRAMAPAELRRARAQMTMVFQDPYSALDPRWSIERIVGEPLRIDGSTDRARQRELISEVLARVGLDDDVLHRLPRAFSGGQRQRIVIARALVTRPRLVFCDEPVSALDVSTRAQVLGLLRELQRDADLSYLFVSHDLGVVERMSDRIAVMYLGTLVEVGDAETVAQRYRHPYTAALVSAAPAPDPVAQRARRRVVLQGDPPSPVDVPSGCAFHPRCPLALDRCVTEKPRLLLDAEGRGVACHVAEQEPSLRGEALFEAMVAREDRPTTPATAGAAPPTAERTGP